MVRETQRPSTTHQGGGPRYYEEKPGERLSKVRAKGLVEGTVKKRLEARSLANAEKERGGRQSARREEKIKSKKHQERQISNPRGGKKKREARWSKMKYVHSNSTPPWRDSRLTHGGGKKNRPCEWRVRSRMPSG